MGVLTFFMGVLTFFKLNHALDEHGVPVKFVAYPIWGTLAARSRSRTGRLSPLGELDGAAIRITS